MMDPTSSKLDTTIKVGIRVRPLIEREKSSGQKSIWKTEKNRIYNQKSDYCFDYVFDHSVSTSHIYNILGKPLIDKAMEGFNGTLFAYGQTASGKTHTIMGDNKELGILPLAIADVFNNTNETPDREFLLRVSYIEIYNEDLTDLLDLDKKGSIKIRNNVDNEVVIENLTEQAITSYDDALDLIQKGMRNRRIGTTNMNERSSRSHVIFRLVIESRQLPDGHNVSENDGAITVSQLNIVDLAGSERVAQTGAYGLRLKESGFINQSLMTLGVVIRKLSDNDGHVPYRDSKLTRILQNSLGGNAKTAIICAASPVVLDETDQTLKFAGRAKKVKNKPKKNEVLDGDTMLKRQMNEIRSLKKKLKEFESGEAHNDLLLAKDKKEQEERIGELVKQIICSGRAPPKEKKRTNLRRLTWCPGGGGGGGMEGTLLEERSLTVGKEPFLQSHVSVRRKQPVSARRRPAVARIIEDEMEGRDLESNTSFEKWEYTFHKQEFEDFKVQAANEKHAKDKEITELKQSIDNLKEEVEHYRKSCSESESTLYDAIDKKTMEQKCQEIEDLSIKNKELLAEIQLLEESKSTFENELNDLKSLIEDQERRSKEHVKNFEKEALEANEITRNENETLKEQLSEARELANQQQASYTDNLRKMEDQFQQLKIFVQTYFETTLDPQQSMDKVFEMLLLTKGEDSEKIKRMEVELSSSLDSLSKAQNRVQSFQASMEMKEVDLQKSIDNILELENAKLQLEKELNGSNKEKKSVLENQQNLLIENNSLKDALGETKAKLEIYEKEISSTNLELKKQKESAESVDQNISALNEKVVILEKENIELKSQLKGKEEQSDELTILQEQILGLEAEIRDLLSEKDKLMNQLNSNDNLQNEHDELKSKMSDLLEEVQNQKAIIDKKDVDLIITDSQNSDMQNEITELQKQVENQITVIEQKTEEIETQKTALAKKDSKVEELEKKTEELEEKLENQLKLIQNTQSELVVELEKQVETYQVEIEQYKKKIEQIVEEKQFAIIENEKLKTEVEELGKSNSGISTGIEEKEIEVSELSQTKETLVKENEALKLELEQISKSKEELMFENENFRKEINAQIQTIITEKVKQEEYMTNLQNKDEKISLLEKELSELKETMKELEEVYQQQFEEQGKSKKDLEEKLTGLERELSQKALEPLIETEANNQDSSHEQRLTELKNEIGNKDAELVKLHDRLALKDNECSSLLNQLDNLKDKIEANGENKERSDINDLKGSVDSLNEEANKKNEVVDELRATIERIESDNKTLQEIVSKFNEAEIDTDSSKDQNDGLKSELLESEKKIKLLQNAASDHENEFKILLMEKNELETLLENLKEENKNLKLDLEEGKADNEKRVSEIANLQTRIEELAAEENSVEELKSQLDDIVEQKKNLLAEISALSIRIKELEPLENTIEDLRSKLADEEKIKNSLQSDIETFKDCMESQESETVSLQNALETKANEFLQLKNNVNIMETKISELCEEIKQKGKVAVEKENQIQEIIRQKEEKEAELESTRNDLKETESLLSNEKDENAFLSKELSNLEEFKKVKQEMEEQLANLLAEKDKANQMLLDKEIEVLSSEKQKESLQNRLAKTEEEMQKYIDENNEFNLAFSTGKAKIQDLQGLLVKVEDENEEMKQQNERLEYKLRTLEDSLGAERSSNNDLKQNIEDILCEKQKELKKAQDESSKLARNHQKTSTELDNRVKEVEMLNGKMKDHKDQHEQLMLTLENKNEEISRYSKEREDLKREIQKLSEDYREKENVCKLTYERKQLEVTTQSDELISCIKKLQSENKELTNKTENFLGEVENLENEKNNLEEQYVIENEKQREIVQGLHEQIEKLNVQVKELDTVKESFVKLCERNDDLVKEKEIIENQCKLIKNTLTEKSKLLSDTEKNSENLKRELEEKRREIKDLREKVILCSEESNNRSESNTNSSALEKKCEQLQMEINTYKAREILVEKEIQMKVEGKSDGLSTEKLLEKLKRSEYSLQLRKEDCQVYKERICELNEEIGRLKEERKRDKVQIKKFTEKMNVIRRPSGKAELREWEERITELENLNITAGIKCERLQEANQELIKENNFLKENQNNAIVRLDLAQKEKKEYSKTLDQLEIYKDQKKELLAQKSKLEKGLSEAYNRMVAAENDVKTLKQEHAAKDAEISKLTNGLTIAFERYKYYKGLALGKPQELEKGSKSRKMSPSKENLNISERRSLLQRSSLLSPTTEPSTELSAGDILASRIISQNIPPVQSSSKKENVLENRSSKEWLFENRSTKVLFENSSSKENKSENVKTSSGSKQLFDLSGATLQSELSSGESDRKRKSDEKLEGNPRRVKYSSVRKTDTSLGTNPRENDPNECKSQ